MPTVEQLRALIASDPNDPFGHYALAQALAKRGDHESALDAYDRCLALDPEDRYGYYHKAVALIALDRSQDARDTIELGLTAAKRHNDAKAGAELRQLLGTIVSRV
ncbi:MAG: tetratricopeptide repeat protein [Planctomycetota bacterium]